MFEVKGTFAIYKNEEQFFGQLQYTLLKALISEGSINAAAKKCHISYQQAWSIADKMNRNSPIPILIRYKGGKDGGGCRVGAYGYKLIKIYEELHSKFVKELVGLNANLDSCLL